MAMSAKCIQQVEAAAGKKLSQAKLAAIEDSIGSQMRELARRSLEESRRTGGPNRWLGLTREQRMTEATAAAMKQLHTEAALKEYRATLQVLRTAETDSRIQAQQRLSKLTRSQGLIRDIEHTGQYADAVRNDSISGLGDLMDAAGSREGTGVLRNLGMRIFDLDNPALTADVVREVFKNADGSTGNAAAKAAAKAWLDTIERMRVRFNRAGGDIGKLSYGYLSQAHDDVRVMQAGAKKWAQDVLPMLDRDQYVKADGSRMADAEVLKLLEAAHDTLSTGGANKTEPGQFKGSGAKANKGSDHRVLHFKDGDAWMSYMMEYGQGSLYDSMMGHIGTMARDIALVERYGPNPEQQFKVQADIAERADGAGTMANRSAGNTPEGYWNVVAGKAGMPQNRLLAQVGGDVRNLQTAAKLGGAVLSSTTDLGTIAASLHFNKLPYFEMLKNVGKQVVDKDTREFLRAHGVIGEALVSTLNRWTGDNMTHSMSGRVAGSVMKLSLMNAWTDGLRNAFSMTMMGGLAKMAKKDWADLAEWDRFLLERKGITQEDWSVVRMAQATDHQGGQYLTPESIRAVTDMDMQAARPAEMARITQEIQTRTAELSARNAEDAKWIRGRIDKFDAARDALNRRVKERAAKRDAKAAEDTGPLLERMALLDAQREAAKLQTDIEADFNKLVTQDEIRAFLNAVEDGASADKTARGGAGQAVRDGLRAAQAAGRRYGEAKGKLERRMQELENKVAQMDRDNKSQTNAEAKAAQAKADEMLVDLREFTKRSQERQQRRQQVIDRLMKSEDPQRAAEAQRLRDQVATKVLSYVIDEAQFAVVNPDIATRAAVTGGGMPAGTVKGEAMRSFAQFKSFPIAMMTRHWRRIFETPQGLEGAPMGYGAESDLGALGNRIAVFAGLNVTLMLLGAVVLQNKALVQGKDPYDMTQGKFWTRSLAQGGGAGYLGDLLFKDPTEQRGNTAEQVVGTVLGPTAGAAAGLAGDIVLTNAWEAAKGKDTKLAAEALRWGNSQLPYQSLWWARGVWERAFLHNAQESLSPGYLARMQQRAQKDWSQGYWWAPGEIVPERAPDLANAVGQ